jgi:hypothetical protein
MKFKTNPKEIFGRETFGKMAIRKSKRALLLYALFGYLMKLFTVL